MYFVLYLDDHDLSVDENDFGQDVLVYSPEDEEDKYIDFDNIELTEDNQLIMKANTDEGEYETITLDLNEEEEDVEEEEEEKYIDDEEEEEDVEEEEEEDYMEEDDPETRSRKVYLNYKEPEVFNPNLPIKRFSFAPGAVNLMSPSPPLKINSSTTKEILTPAKSNTRTVSLTSSVSPSIHFTYHQDRLFNRPIIPSAMKPNEQEYKYKSPPRSRRHKNYKNGTGNRYIKNLNRFPYDVASAGADGSATEQHDYEPEWLKGTRLYDYWMYNNQ